MTTDNPDKTVFRTHTDQRTASGDSTIIRPTPGRRSGHTQVSQQTGSTQLKTPVQQQPAPSTPGAPAFDMASGHFQTFHGLNPLVNAASMLIAVCYKTRQSVTHNNVGGLHQQLVSAIRTFESNAKDKNIKPEIVLVARYILCTTLDEIVLNTPWGADSAWPQRTLLSVFHNETHGGEKFFLLLDKMKESPAENLDVLELMYILISMGFEGKYRVVARGRDMIEQIRDELFRTIRSYRGEYERSLSPHWQGLGRIKNTLAQYVPMWVIASVVCGILVLSYSGFRYWMYKSSDHVVQQLNQIAADEINKPARLDAHNVRND